MICSISIIPLTSHSDTFPIIFSLQLPLLALPQTCQVNFLGASALALPSTYSALPIHIHLTLHLPQVLTQIDFPSEACLDHPI